MYDRICTLNFDVSFGVFVLTTDSIAGDQINEQKNQGRFYSLEQNVVPFSYPRFFANVSWRTRKRLV